MPIDEISFGYELIASRQQWLMALALPPPTPSPLQPHAIASTPSTHM
jgi:hypothetical protein